MATRDWDRLGDAQRDRYLGYGRKRGWSQSRVRREYESGKPLSHMRGKGRTRAEENKKDRDRKKAYRLARDNNMRGGMTMRDYYRDDDGGQYGLIGSYGAEYGWAACITRLEHQAVAIDNYRKGNKEPGRTEWYTRWEAEPLEHLWFYH